MRIPVIWQLLVGPTATFPFMGSLGKADVAFQTVARMVLKHEQNIQFFIVVSSSAAKEKSMLPAVVPALNEYGARKNLVIEFGRCRKISFPHYSLKHQGTKIVYLNFPEYTDSEATKYDPL